MLLKCMFFFLLFHFDLIESRDYINSFKIKLFRVKLHYWNSYRMHSWLFFLLVKYRLSISMTWISKLKFWVVVEFLDKSLMCLLHRSYRECFESECTKTCKHCIQYRVGFYQLWSGKSILSLKNQKLSPWLAIFQWIGFELWQGVRRVLDISQVELLWPVSQARLALKYLSIRFSCFEFLSRFDCLPLLEL